MPSIDTSSASGQLGDLVSIGVLRKALDVQQSEGAQLLKVLQPPAQSGGSSGRLVDVYA